MMTHSPAPRPERLHACLFLEGGHLHLQVRHTPPAAGGADRAADADPPVSTQTADLQVVSSFKPTR